MATDHLAETIRAAIAAWGDDQRLVASIAEAAVPGAVAISATHTFASSWLVEYLLPRGEAGRLLVPDSTVALMRT